MWLDDRYIMSYKSTPQNPTPFHIFIYAGARGIGKTYLAKKRVLRERIKKGKNFIWVRNTDAMVDQLKQNLGYNFYADLQQNGFLKKYKWELRINGDNTIEIKLGDGDWAFAGYVMPLSLYYKLKGNSFATIDNIVFDEFISEEDEVIRGNRARQFVNTLETIGRLRTDYTVYMLTNSINLADNILNLFFKARDIKDYGVYFNKEKGAILYYVPDSKEFNDKRFDSIAGKVLKDTAYEDNIAHNKFNRYDSMYFDTKPKGLTFVYVLVSDTYKIGVYVSKDAIYAMKHNNYKTTKVFSKDIKSKVDGGRVVTKDMLTSLRKLYMYNRILFDDETTRQYFVDFVN